jgi:hypothetical protein
VWRFVLAENVDAGLQTSIQASGRIGFNTASVKATGLPSSTHTRLSAAAGAVSVPLVVTNTGATTKAFFADARLGAYTQVSLPTALCSAAATAPGLCAYAYVPTQTLGAAFVAQSTVPLSMDDAWSIGGAPDIFASAVGKDTVAAFTVSPEVAYGAWVLLPTLVGPFGAAGEATEAVTTSVTATIRTFDSTVSADSGDLWADLTLGTSTFAPLVLAPGASGTITLTITPDATKVGSQVTGAIYLDTYNGYDNYGSGDEIASVPYAYTISK